MQNKDKVVVFDFCETLVPFQSASKFVHYVLKTSPKPISLLRYFVYKVFSHFGLVIKIERSKKNRVTEKLWLLHLIKGYSESEIQTLATSYYYSELKPNLIPETMELLLSYQAQGYRIMIASGGYDVYIQEFAKDYNICKTDVLSTKLQFVNNKFTGKFDGLDCMSQTKVEVLNSIINKDSTFIIAYSDSITDLPLLTWADEGYAVLKRPLWPSQNGLNILYWNK